MMVIQTMMIQPLTDHSDDNAFASVRLLAHSIPIVSQRLENGPVAICVPTYRLQVRIIKRQASLSLPGASRRENGEIRELEKSQTETRPHLASMLTSTG